MHEAALTCVMEIVEVRRRATHSCCRGSCRLIKKVNNDEAVLEYQLLSTNVAYFDQLSSAAQTRKLVEILFVAVFNLFQTGFLSFCIRKKKKDLKNTVFSYSLKLVDI